MKDQDNIKRSIETRLKTVMIGTLSRFEEGFGYLWNNGDPPNNKSEAFFLNLWEEIRTDILDHGNNQIRIALEDLSRTIERANRFEYQYNFILNKLEENTNE